MPTPAEVRAFQAAAHAGQQQAEQALRAIFTAQGGLDQQRALLDRLLGKLPKDPNADPTFQLVQAAKQNEINLLNSALRQLTTNVNASRDTSLADLAVAGGEQRRGTRGGFESRGLRASGGFLGAIARQRRDEARKSAAIRSGAARKIGEAQSSTAIDVAGRQSEQAQRFAEATANLAQQRSQLRLLRSQVPKSANALLG